MENTHLSPHITFFSSTTFLTQDICFLLKEYVTAALFKEICVIYLFFGKLFYW